MLRNKKCKWLHQAKKKLPKPTVDIDHVLLRIINTVCFYYNCIRHLQSIVYLIKRSLM